MAPLSTFTAFASVFAFLLPQTFAGKYTLRREGRSLSDPEPLHFLPPTQPSHGRPSSDDAYDSDLELLDIALVASVDGKFHAMNRDTGQVIWSMGASAASNSGGGSQKVIPDALAPLVRTQHVDPDPVHDTNLDDPREFYIVEPQSGDIYVLPSSSEAGSGYGWPGSAEGLGWDAPLQKLPFSMQQLVDMSPFSFNGDDENRVFVGKKETSLLMLELETGRLKGTVNSECPWFPEREREVDAKLEDMLEEGIDLDELDGTKPPRTKPVSTEVLIGRTDYTVSIHTRSRTSGSPPPVQTLVFSTYGPNNQDLGRQASYHRTPDDTYIQSMANGEVLAFRAGISSSAPHSGHGSTNGYNGGQSQLLWGNTFKSPIVTVFDVLKPCSSQGPVVALLQPQPRLQDFIPSFSDTSDMGYGTGLDGDAAFVGLVRPDSSSAGKEDEGSLFALSPVHFPLVIFSQPNYHFTGLDQGGKYGGQGARRAKLRTIDAPPDSVIDEPAHMNDIERMGLDYVSESELPSSVDDVTRMLKERAKCARPNSGSKTLNGHGVGKGGGWSRECVTGKRPVIASSQSRLSRLLPDKPAVHPSQSYPYPQLPSRFIDDDGLVDRESRDPRGIRERTRTGPRYGAPDANYSDGHDGAVEAGNEHTVRNGRKIGGGLMAILVLLGSLWVLSKRSHAIVSPAVSSSTTEKVETSDASAPVLNAVQKGGAVSPIPEEMGLGDGSHGLHSGEISKILDPRLAASGNVGDSTPELVSDGSSTSPKVDSTASSFSSKPLPPTPPLESSSEKESTGDLSEPKFGGDAIKAMKGEGDADDDSDQENDPEGEVRMEDGVGSAAGKKKSNRRRRRGKKHRGEKGAVIPTEAPEKGKSEGEEGGGREKGEEVGTAKVVGSKSGGPLHLEVSDEVLGLGSHGTVVYRGALQGRAVAVKRLLRDFVTLATREVSLLQESDDHPNVIRYFYLEAPAQSDFLYIALELCPASLADVIEHPNANDEVRAINNAFDPKRALTQVLEGVRHLHALKIIHRDIKPQNILVSAAKKGLASGSMAGHRMLISDFGLCRRLEMDQTSFLPTTSGAGAAGTSGWRAPEILRGEVNADEPASATDESTLSSKGSGGTAVSPSTPTANGSSRQPTRLTKKVDIFALGCLAYYILTNGSHPYGDRFERDVNIIRGEKNLEGLEGFGEEGLEAVNLITLMLSDDATQRPDTSTCLTHPFFWTPARRLTFLQDASDRFEIMCREPRDPDLIALEQGALGVVGTNWQARLDRVFLENLGKFRKYDGKSVQDLMRALRNKKHHYQDLPENVKRQLGPLPDGFLAYFTRRFPNLFMHVHSVVAKTNLRYESMFRAYFDPPE